MLLLDTHAILWYVTGNHNLSEFALEKIEKEKCFFSTASLWEIALKQNIGKLDFRVSIQVLEETLLDLGFLRLPATAQDFEKIKSLPFVHRDPFDRLLIAQALNNNLTIVSKDRMFSAYGIEPLW